MTRGPPHPRARARRSRSGPFRLHPIRVAHSVTDSLALAIETPAGVVLASGDFKIDAQAPPEERTDVEALAAWGDRGVLVLLSDSTNVEQQGAHRGRGRRAARVPRDPRPHPGQGARLLLRDLHPPHPARGRPRPRARARGGLPRPPHGGQRRRGHGPRPAAPPRLGPHATPAGLSGRPGQKACCSSSRAARASRSPPSRPSAWTSTATWRWARATRSCSPPAPSPATSARSRASSATSSAAAATWSTRARARSTCRATAARTTSSTLLRLVRPRLPRAHPRRVPHARPAQAPGRGGGPPRGARAAGRGRRRAALRRRRARARKAAIPGGPGAARRPGRPGRGGRVVRDRRHLAADGIVVPVVLSTARRAAWRRPRTS